MSCSEVKYVTNKAEVTIVKAKSGKIGLLIGQGGEKVKELQKASGCKINVPSRRGAPLPPETLVDVSLQGNETQRNKATELIKELVSKLYDRPG